MVVGIGRVSVELPGVLSLKEKRGPLRSIITRVRQTFNVAVAEVGDQDAWQTAVLGLAVISGDARHANEMLSKVVAFIEDNLDGAVVADIETELIHVGD
jgi:uncharacterized protein YlxP (DUF503 family)